MTTDYTEIDPKEVGKILRTLRGSRTMEDAEAASGIPWHTIGRLERAEYKTLPFETLVRLVSAYHLSPNDLAELLGLYTSVESMQDTGSPRVQKMFSDLQHFINDFEEDQQAMLADTVIALVHVRRSQLLNQDTGADLGTNTVDIPEHIRRKLYR